MKCTVEKSLLLAHLQKVCNVIERRGTLPILGNLKFEAKEESLTLTATNLEIRIDTTMKAAVTETGSTTIPAKNLLALTAKFKGNEVRFSSNKNFQTKIECGTSEFNLLGLDPTEFPAVFEFESKRKCKIKQSDFVRMIDAVSYAVCSDDARKALQGILLSLKDGFLTAVATDGKRLALIEKQAEEASENMEIILPLKTALEAKRLLGDEGVVELELDDRMIRIQIGETVLLSKLIEGNYPNYKQVIPASFSKEVKLQSAELIASLELVAVPLNGVNGNVTLTFRKGELELFTQSTSIGEGRDKLEVAYDEDAEFTVIFNLAYLLAPFKYTGRETLTVKMNEPAFPVALDDGDFRYIIMPIRAK